MVFTGKEQIISAIIHDVIQHCHWAEVFAKIH